MTAEVKTGLPAQIRVQDTEGGMWTVPPGSLLHGILRIENRLGYLVPIVSISVIRQPEDTEIWKQDPGTPRTFLQGEWTRLRDRVLKRGVQMKILERSKA